VLVAKQHNFIFDLAADCWRRYTHANLYQLSNIVFLKLRNMKSSRNTKLFEYLIRTFI
jgi:hypothetical protein